MIFLSKTEYLSFGDKTKDALKKYGVPAAIIAGGIGLTVATGGTDLLAGGALATGATAGTEVAAGAEASGVAAEALSAANTLGKAKSLGTAVARTPLVSKLTSWTKTIVGKVGKVGKGLDFGGSSDTSNGLLNTAKAIGTTALSAKELDKMATGLDKLVEKGLSR